MSAHLLRWSIALLCLSMRLHGAEGARSLVRIPGMPPGQAQHYGHPLPADHALLQLLIVDDAGLRRLQTDGIRYALLHADLDAVLRHERGGIVGYADSTAADAGFYTASRDLAAVLTRWRDLVAAHPDLCREQQYGTSH
ncbi:MAG: hypothetical protein ACOCXJ_08850, partial [Planctomycetota bacterium]